MPQKTRNPEEIVAKLKQVDVLTADIVALAIECGRYGYRRITAMLRAAVWTVNVKGFERIWRQERLKASGKQLKKRRL